MDTSIARRLGVWLLALGTASQAVAGTATESGSSTSSGQYTLNVTADWTGGNGTAGFYRVYVASATDGGALSSYSSIISSPATTYSHSGNWAGSGHTTLKRYELREYSSQTVLDSVEHIAGPNSRPVTVAVSLRVGPPPKYKATIQVQNDSDYKRHVKVDADGDGVTDDEFDLEPGGLYGRTFERETAPAAYGTILASGVNAAGESLYSIEAIPSAAWTNDGNQVPVEGYISPGIGIKKDTQAKTGNAIEFNAASGGALSESTAQTGFGAVRNAIVEAAKSGEDGWGKLREVMDELEPLTRSVTNELAKINGEGMSQTVQDRWSSTFGAKQTETKTAMESFAQAFKYQLFPSGEGNLSKLAGVTTPYSDLLQWRIFSGSQQWVVRPFNDPKVELMLTALRALVVWAAWYMFATKCYEEGAHKVAATMAAGQAWQGSSNIPLISAGASAVAAGIFVAAMLVGGALIFSTAATMVMGFGTFDSLGLSWMQDQDVLVSLRVADLFFPLSVIVGMLSGWTAWKVASDAICTAAMAAAKFLSF